MPFIGNPITSQFQARTATQEFNGDGSTTTFTPNQAVTQEDIIVSVDGVVQESVDAFTVPDGTTSTFTAAPSSGTGNIFVIYMGVAASSVTPPEQNKGNIQGWGDIPHQRTVVDGRHNHSCNENANVTGPFTVASGVTLTVESGGTLVTL